jgi:hypothetical protein
VSPYERVEVAHALRHIPASNLLDRSLALKLHQIGTLLIGLALTQGATAQVGAPQQPASSQRPEGTAAATAGKATSNAGPPVEQKDTAPPAPESTPRNSTEGGLMVASPDAPKAGPLPEKNVEDPSDTTDILPPALMPKTPATLIGGTVKAVDPVNDRITVQAFGSKSKFKVFFDERSKLTRNGRPADPSAIHIGDRVYLDTQLDKKKGKIFARTVRLQTKQLQADAHGQIVGYDPKTRLVTVHDDLSGQNVRFHLQQNVSVDNMGHAGTPADLLPGAPVTARFLPGQEDRNEVNQVLVLSAPGSDYTFEGRVTHLDLRNQTIAVENQADGKIYDLHFDPKNTPVGGIKEGSLVSASAKFNGNGYDAESLSPATGVSLEEQEQAAKDEEKADQSDDSDKKGKSKKEKKQKHSKKDKDKDADSDDTGDLPK